MSSIKNSKPYNPPKEERQMARVMRGPDGGRTPEAISTRSNGNELPKVNNIETVNNRLINTKERLTKLHSWIDNERSAIMIDARPRVDETGPLRHEMPPFFTGVHNHLDDIDRIIADIEDQIKRMEL